jgi:hypothetical protein
MIAIKKIEVEIDILNFKLLQNLKNVDVKFELI